MLIMQKREGVRSTRKSQDGHVFRDCTFGVPCYRGLRWVCQFVFRVGAFYKEMRFFHSGSCGHVRTK